MHPPIHRRLWAGSPICLMGRAVEGKAAQTVVSRSQSCDGWQWLTISVYDFGSTQDYYKWKKNSSFCRVSVKVPCEGA